MSECDLSVAEFGSNLVKLLNLGISKILKNWSSFQELISLWHLLRWQEHR